MIISARYTSLLILFGVKLEVAMDVAVLNSIWIEMVFIVLLSVAIKERITLTYSSQRSSLEGHISCHILSQQFNLLSKHTFPIFSVTCVWILSIHITLITYLNAVSFSIDALKIAYVLIVEWVFEQIFIFLDAVCFECEPKTLINMAILTIALH